MPAHLLLIKTPQGWANGNSQTEDFHHKTKLGTSIHGKFTKMRNAGFHRKYFALLNLGFEYWEPPELPEEYGRTPEKNFDRFRYDLAIMCGYYHVVVRLDGSTRIEPDSISWGSMDQETFEKLYSKTLDILLKSVPMLSKMDVEKVTNQFLEFA